MAKAGTPPRAEASQRTVRNAVLAALMLLVLVGVGATLWSGGWTTPPTMERYMKLGPRLGPAELETELMRDFPPGSGIGPLFARLERLGFDCAAALDPTRPGDCRFRTRRDDGRLVTFLVTVGHDGVQVRAVAAQAAVGPPPGQMR